MREHIEAYLNAHKLAWSPTTFKSETLRLSSIRDKLSDPRELYEALVARGLKPYSIKTYFIRAVALEAWAEEEGLVTTRPFRKFLKLHANLFKHVYQRKEVTMTYEEAEARINTLASPYREAALTILYNGLRISELATIKDGHVTGKGGKRRKLFGIIQVAEPVNASTLRQQLSRLGIAPHALRKLAATKLVTKGATAADLCQILGWGSIATAYLYLQPRSESRLIELVRG